MLRHEFEQFAGALLDPAAALPPGLKAHGVAALSERFAVYRNNVVVGLIDTLAARFPVTRALVGDEFFRAMAREFVYSERPADAVLFAYGDGLPEFIGAFTPAASLTYLSDVARLEAAWTQSWGAPEAPVLTLESLGEMPVETLLDARVRTHPAARLLHSNAPVASLWQAHQRPEPDLSAIPWQSEDVLVTRPDAEVRLRQLARGAAVFAQALASGHTIEAAAGIASSECGTFDAGPAFAGLVSDGFIAELRP